MARSTPILRKEPAVTVLNKSAVPFLMSAALLAIPLAAEVSATEVETPLYVGWAVADITPPKPVALIGQGRKTIAYSVHDPLTATVLALETRGEGGAKEQAIMISCDLLWINKVTQDKVKELVKTPLADFDADKLFMNGIHTHTGPGLAETFGKSLDVSEDPGVWKMAEYAEFFYPRVVEAVQRAWNGRKPAGMSWALGQAVVGHNRRSAYANGSAVMYGHTNRPDFLSVEGYEDHGLELLFFWDQERKLTGLLINLACPSQETETQSYLSADFWHEIRQEIGNRYGKEVHVFPQCAPAGDQSPHLLWRQRAEQEMLHRKGISRRQEIALRVARGVDEVFPYAKEGMKTAMVFKHEVARVNLPLKEPPAAPFYEPDSPRPVELHLLRLGDVAVATNPFELFLDYGIRIKARSKAMLTLTVQLASGACGYLPTAKAVAGGGYSADKYVVSPEGGQVLVDETVKRINAMWGP